jgi:hypothetical protein
LIDSNSIVGEAVEHLCIRLTHSGWSVSKIRSGFTPVCLEKASSRRAKLFLTSSRNADFESCASKPAGFVGMSIKPAAISRSRLRTADMSTAESPLATRHILPPVFLSKWDETFSILLMRLFPYQRLAQSWFAFI